MKKIKLSKRATWIALSLVLLLGFFLRAAYCFQLKNTLFFEPGVGIDTNFYDTWAQTISAGDWVRKEVFWAAPGYPYFLGVIYSFFGRNLLLVGLVQAFLGTLSCLLIFLVARHFFGAFCGLSAAFIAATYQMFIFHDAMLLGTSLFIFLNSLGLYMLTIALDKRRWWFFVGAGLALGAAVLTGISTLLFLLMVGIWLFWRRQFAAALILWGAVLLTILPVTFRNYAIAKDFVPITAHGGLNFYIGNNPSATGVYDPPELMLGSSTGLIKDSQTLAKKELGRDLKPSEVSGYWFKKGLSFIADSPGRYIWLTARKAGLCVNAVEITDILNVDLVKRSCSVLRAPLIRFGWLFPPAVIGIFLTWRRLRGKRLLFFFLMGQFISCCLYFVNARYRLPLVIVLCIFGGYALSWSIRNIYRRRFFRVFRIVLAWLAISMLAYLPLYHKDNVVDIYNLALAYQRKERFAEAEILLRKCVRLSPHFSDGYYALGFLYWQAGKRQQALFSYKKALAVDPNFAEVRYNLGLLYAEDGKLEEAQREYETAVALKPDYREALVSVCSLCMRYADPLRAQQCWRNALTFDPQNMVARRTLDAAQTAPQQ